MIARTEDDKVKPDDAEDKKAAPVGAQAEKSKIPSKMPADDFSGGEDASAEDTVDKFEKHVADIYIYIESELNPKVEDAGAKEVTAAEASAKDGEGSAAEEAGAAPDAMTESLYGDLGLFR